MAITTEHDLTTWPGWLRELRERHGITQTELATKLACKRLAVARWETDAARPLRVFRRILAHLGRDVHLPPPPEDE